jgi:RNA polymerase sigma factor (sigma-70 family)
MTPPPSTTSEPHDDDRCSRLYRQCKTAAVAYARRLLASADGSNRYLAAFDAEEFYDVAWETYYDRREYLDDRDHVAHLNALILSRYRDERRRSRADKRSPPGRPVDFAQAEAASVAGAEGRDLVADRDELRRLLARVESPADRRALYDHEVRGLSFAEIGRNEGITAEAARRRALRARRQARGED